MARDDPSAESSPASASLSTAPTSLDTVAQTHFKCSVTVRDLERESLSRSHDHVRCFIAHDDAASLNLYIDQREGLDYLYHRLTDNIRHVYAGRGRNVNVQLSSKKRLEIVLQSDDSKQRLFELLSKIEARELSHEHFPKAMAKSTVFRIDPSIAYVTASDVWTEEVEMTTPPRLRKHGSDSSFLVEHGEKRTKAHSSMCYRSHQPPPVSPSHDDLPAEWHPPSSPLQNGLELMTPSNSRTLAQAIGQMPSISRSPPITSKDTLLAKLSVYAPRASQRAASSHGRGARSFVAQKPKVTYADSISSSRCADAVLQAVLGLEAIKQELRHSHWLSAIDGQECLFKSIVDVCSQRTRECIPLKTDKIKRLVTKRTSSSNPLNSQDEDAQVFLEELLNQSRQSIRARAINEYPFVGKFECDIDHRLVCMTCGKERIHTEQNQILSLDLQERTRASKQKAATIQSLLPRFFSPQEISFYCDACEGEKAVAHRTVSRLPKVLVLHLKRFQRDERDHPWTNDEPVTLEDSLLLDQYCNAEALGSALRFDEGLENIPATPSDGLPSSDDSRYSSRSPTRSLPARASTRSSQLSLVDHGSLGSGHDQYPTIHYILDSDDEENPTQLPSNTIDLVEDSDEELQYRWAIEDSIRVQSLSQSSVSYEEHEDSTRIGDETLTDSIYEDIKALTSNDLSFMADVRDTASSSKHNPALLKDESFTNHQQRSGTSTPTMAPPKMILPELFAMTNGGNLPTPSALKPTKAEDDAKNSKGNHDRSLFKDEKDDLKKNIDGKDDFQGGNDVDGDDSDSDDEDFKRAIQASLQPCSTTSVSEKEVKEQEDRDLEEAIRRSLLDQEDNKENISPEDFDDQKKAKNEVDGDGGGKQPSKRGDMHSEATDNSGNSGNRLSFSQPVGKRDLDLHGGGRRSGNDLKRAQLRRCSSIDVSSMMVRTRTRSGNSRSDIQIHQHTTTSSSSSSLQRTPSEYNLRSLESRVSRRDSAESSSLASKGLSTTKVTKPDTATSKKGDGTRPASVAGSTSSLGVLTPPTPTTPPKEKSAGDSRRVASLSSPSTRRSMTTASRPPITSSGSSSTSTMPSKTTRADNSQQHADQSDPDNVATRPPGDETERAGLYRLRAVVSKPASGGGMNGGGSGQQAGYYLCDSLGSDGVWRCFDHQTVRRIGSWANMDQQRARIGYLAIYVHTV